MTEETKEEVKPIRLDLGCGKNKKPDFTGVDQYEMDGVDVVQNLTEFPWQWEDNSVEEVHCSHFLEHLTALQRVQFINELYRILKPGAKATIITPHWCSNRAYGDFTHQFPAVSEMYFYYLDAGWREKEAPHTDKKWNPDGFTCDFIATWGYSFGPDLQVRNQEYQQFALMNYKEAALDIHATLVKKVI